MWSEIFLFIFHFLSCIRWLRSSKSLMISQDIPNLRQRLHQRKRRKENEAVVSILFYLSLIPVYLPSLLPFSYVLASSCLPLSSRHLCPFLSFSEPSTLDNFLIFIMIDCSYPDSFYIYLMFFSFLGPLITSSISILFLHPSSLPSPPSLPPPSSLLPPPSSLLPPPSSLLPPPSSLLPPPSSPPAPLPLFALLIT